MVDLLTLILGIILALTATACVNIGVALQKKGLKEGLPELNLEGGVGGLGNSFKKYFKNKSWAIGFILGPIGWIPYVIAQGMVGIIVVQPLQAVGLIIMVIMASKILEEKISYIEILAILMLIIAPILIAFSGISSVQIDLYSFVLPFFIFSSIVVLIIIICILLGRKYKDKKWAGLYKVIIAGLTFSIGGMFSNIFAQAYTNASINIISPLGWAEIIFGIFWFEYYHLWVFLGVYGMLILFLIGIIYQNNALLKGKAILLWPIQSTINLIVPVIGGFIIFNQSVNCLLLFILALIIIFIATIILSRIQAKLDK